MQNMILVLTLNPEEQALWVGRHAMVVALDNAETATLRFNMIAVHEFLQFNLKCLSTLQQVLESSCDALGRIRKTLEMLMEPARKASGLQKDTRALLGRAVFIGPNEAKGRVQ
jgi:hypothetical protein